MSLISTLTSPFGIAAFSTANKAIGPVYRYNIDYDDAPPDTKRDELHREVSLLALTFFINWAVQILAHKRLPKLIPALAKNTARAEGMRLVSKLALTIPGTIVAEGISRVIGKPPEWNRLDNKNGTEPETETDTEPDRHRPAEAEDSRDDDYHDDDKPAYSREPASQTQGPAIRQPLAPQQPPVPASNPFTTRPFSFQALPPQPPRIPAGFMVYNQHRTAGYY